MKNLQKIKDLFKDFPRFLELFEGMDLQAKLTFLRTAARVQQVTPNMELNSQLRVIQEIERAKQLHNNKYDYSRVPADARTHQKVPIICPIHGEFLVTMANHAKSKKCSGCPNCGRLLTGATTFEARQGKTLDSLGQPEGYKLLPLRKGILLKVDNEDFQKLIGIPWRFGSQKEVRAPMVGRLDQLLMNAKPLEVFDHINGDERDFRKSNLRRRITYKNKVPKQYRGVVFQQGKFHARVMHEGITYSAHGFKTELEAAKRYDEMAIKIKGEKAILNFPKTQN